MSSYHGWTHARKEDGGTDPIVFPPAEAVFPWIRAGQASRTCTTSLKKRAPLRTIQYDTTITTIGTGGDFSFAAISDGLAFDIYEITVRKEGFYLFDYGIITNIGGGLTDDAGTVDFGLTTDAGNELSEIADAYDIFDTTTFSSGSQGEGIARPRMSGTIYVANGRVFKPWFRQSSGGNLDLGVDWFFLARLQETDGLAWTQSTL